MAKGHSDHHQQHDQGTPTYIIMSVLFAIVIFAFEGIKATIVLAGADYQTQSTMLGFIGLGLAICFFWRRLHDSLFKILTAVGFTTGLWAYLVATTVLPLLTSGGDAASRLQLIHQCGLGGVVIIGFMLMAALLYHQKPVPALLMTTFAGFMVGFGSLYPLLRPGSATLSHDYAIENRSHHAPKKVDVAEEDMHRESDHHSTQETAEEAMGPQEVQHEHQNEGKPAARMKLSAHANAAHDDKLDDHEPDENEGHVHKILRKELAAAEDEKTESKPHTLSAAQKARLQIRSQTKSATGHGAQPKHANSSSKGKSPAQHKQQGKTKMSLAAKASLPHGPHWDYAGEYGPESWGEIEEAFKLCSTGLEQSPINIMNGWPTRDAIELDYKHSTFQVIDNGHTVQVNVERGNFANIAGQRYELKQFHFHAPSEHLVENRPYQMEVHFVHANDKGQLAVIGAFINPGKSHAGYQTVWDYTPIKANAPIKPYNITLDLRRLLPTALIAFNYAGSLTTPPCSENVNWNVLHATLKLSQDQIDRFKLKYQMNARPVQPLNYRKP